MNKPKVIKMGGSLLSRSDQVLFDFDYFYKFRELLVELTDDGESFVLNVGGGYLARKYQQMLQEHGERNIEDVHSVGVAATNMNAEIVHGLLDELAADEIIRYDSFDEFMTGADSLVNFAQHPIQVASASKPGTSNDWNSLQMALRLNVTELFNVKDIDGVYDADPAKFPDAQLQQELTWEKYLEIIGNPKEHKPGAKYPIDPIAARLAQEHDITFIVVGSDLHNLREALLGRNFRGSVISN